VEQFAKDSDAGIVAVKPLRLPDDLMQSLVQPQSETRLVTRPKVTHVVTDEEWARSMTGVPALALSTEALKELPLDHRAGFLISLMDGSVDLEMLVELAPLPREDALRIVRELHESQVIEFR